MRLHCVVPLLAFALLFQTRVALDTSPSSAAVRFAVTNLFLVSANSSQLALEQCQQTPHAQAVGIDWGNNDDSRVLQLCLTRERVDTLLSTSSSTHVVQRIAVYESSECLPTEFELFRPREQLVVCVRRLALSPDVLSSGNFLSDVWVSVNQNYNSFVPGWTGINTNVQERADSIWRRFWQWIWRPSYVGVFLSYQKPLLPIREVQIVTVSAVNATADTCIDALGVVWERVGDLALDVTGDTTKKAGLCIRRREQADGSWGLVLTGVTVVEREPSQCTARGDIAVTTALALPSRDQHLCLTWEHVANTSSTVLVGLLNQEEGSTRDGQLDLVGSIDSATKHPIFLYTQSSWKRLEIVHEPDNENGLLNKPPLRASLHVDASNGNATSLTFKVLQIADLHYSGDPAHGCQDVPSNMNSRDCSEALMSTFVDELLEVEKPDFVVFSGDNVQVFKKRLRQIAIDSVVKAVEARGAPYAVIFGNHDDERGFTREQMMQMYVKKPLAYTRRGPLNVDGVGNYELNVQAPQDGNWGQKGTDVFRMYFLDSHAKPDSGRTPLQASKYDWIKPSQIAYYRQLAHNHSVSQSRVPAIMFFHIPLPEYALDPRAGRTVGEHRELVGSSAINTHLFSTLVELGDVKATFCGHDHLNDYCYKRDGVHLCYGGGIGFGSAYGSRSVKRRARIIEWRVDAQNRRTIRSWRRIFGETNQRQLEELLYTDGR